MGFISGSSLFHIRGTGELDKLSVREKRVISSDLKSFLDKYQNRFKEAHLSVNFKLGKETFRGLPMVNCTVSLITDHGRFNSVDKGWGALNAVHNVLKNMSYQIEKKFSRFNVHVKRNAVVR